MDAGTSFSDLRAYSINCPNIPDYWFPESNTAAFLRAEAGGPQRINTAEEHKAEQKTETDE